MLALHHTPVELVRQVRLELTIPCLRGRCLDPIWLLTHGGTERTRTVIGLVDNQVPHLSATVPKISDCRLPIANLLFQPLSYCSLLESDYFGIQANRQSAMLLLGGSKGVEPSVAAVTVRCSAI
jgi:hypothetical protein